MTLDVLGDLNWLTVLVAAIAFFALDAVWYAQPVFGKAWTRASNFQLPEGDTLGGLVLHRAHWATSFGSDPARRRVSFTTLVSRSPRRLRPKAFPDVFVVMNDLRGNGPRTENQGRQLGSRADSEFGVDVPEVNLDGFR